MTNSGAGSFSRLNARRQARFISYREALEKLAADSGDDLAEIAGLLKAYDIHERGTAWLYGPERAVQGDVGSGRIAILLYATIESGIIKGVDEGYNGPCGDPDTDGWIREKFVDALVKAELPCPATLLEPPPYVPSNALTRMPVWMKPYLSRQEITVGEAKYLLMGVNPQDNGLFPDEAESEARAWRKSLIDAVNNELIQGSQWGADQDEQELSHTDIQRWSAKFKYPWPIPEIAPSDEIASSTLKTDEELLKRFAEEQEKRTIAEYTIAELEKKLVAAEKERELLQADLLSR
jgi:hypothetical protein